MPQTQHVGPFHVHPLILFPRVEHSRLPVVRRSSLQPPIGAHLNHKAEWKSALANEEADGLLVVIWKSMRLSDSVIEKVQGVQTVDNELVE